MDDKSCAVTVSGSESGSSGIARCLPGAVHWACRFSCPNPIRRVFESDTDTDTDPDAEGTGGCDTTSKTGIQDVRWILDSRIRGSDSFGTFYGFIDH